MAMTAPVVANAQGIRATVDGDRVDFAGAQPVMMANHVMVPVRGVFEKMNATVDWNANTRTVVAHRGNDIIKLPINSYIARVNGRNVRLDSPATIYQGSTMVPLRFVSEAFGANVHWNESAQTVEISTSDNGAQGVAAERYTTARIDSGTVAPFTLNERLSSNGSVVGDRFTANVDTNGGSNYQDLRDGAVLEGHVSAARAKSGDQPGVLGLAFDRLTMSDGRSYPVYGTLIGLDEKSVTNDNGRLVAKPSAKNDNLKYIGLGAGGGALLAVITKQNLVSTTLIGGALGYLLGEIQKNPSSSRDVTLDSGSKFGVRLTRDLSFRVPSPGNN